jgi:hypothetical protein
MHGNEERHEELAEIVDADERVQGQHLVNEMRARARAVRAPASFQAQGMVRIRALPPPSSGSLAQWREALKAWRPRPVVWAPVLAISFVLSLICNGWLGYRMMSLQRQLAEPLLALERESTARDLLTHLDLRDQATFFNSYLFQSSIKTETSLGVLAAAHPAFEERSMALGFAATSEFYVVGALYAEALAFLRSGNFDVAAKRLVSIEKELRRVQVPSSLAKYVSNMRHVLESGKYRPMGLRDGLALFQPLCEEYARSQGTEQLTLFRVGAWLVHMRLTAAAGDKALLQQGNRARYFLHEMQNLHAPQGVLEALGQLSHLVAKPQIADGDVQEVLQLVQKIQTILG